MQTQIPFFAKYKSLIILVLDFILMLVLINTLPFSPKENRGLALLTSILMRLKRKKHALKEC